MIKVKDDDDAEYVTVDVDGIEHVMSVRTAWMLSAAIRLAADKANVVVLQNMIGKRSADVSKPERVVAAAGDQATSNCLTCGVSAQQIIEALADDAHSQKLHPVLLKACSYCIVRARELVTPNAA